MEGSDAECTRHGAADRGRVDRLTTPVTGTTPAARGRFEIESRAMRERNVCGRPSRESSSTEPSGVGNGLTPDLQRCEDRAIRIFWTVSLFTLTGTRGTFRAVLT